MPLEPAYMKVSIRAPQYLGRFRDGAGVLVGQPPYGRRRVREGGQ